MAYEPDCKEPCSCYSHLHCSDCNEVLTAYGDNGLYGGVVVGGYNDPHGNGSIACDTCDSRRCEKCGTANTTCAFCREYAEQPCHDCRLPAGMDAVDLGLRHNGMGYVQVGPTCVVCHACARMRAA